MVAFDRPEGKTDVEAATDTAGGDSKKGPLISGGSGCITHGLQASGRVAPEGTGLLYLIPPRATVVSIPPKLVVKTSKLPWLYPVPMTKLWYKNVLLILKMPVFEL